MRVYAGRGAFAAFYSVSEQAAGKLLGPDGWRSMAQTDAELSASALDRQFESIELSTS